MSVYYEYRISTDCPECMHPLVVNGPFLEVSCTACGALVPLVPDFWKVRFTIEEGSGFFVQGERLGPEPGKKKKPACYQCGGNLPADTVADGADGVVVCPGCGTLHATYPVPDWIHGLAKKNLHPCQVFCADKDGKDDSFSGAAGTPIAFSCVSCGAALELHGETPRIMECGFCNTKQFLPGALWHALHPVRKIRPWYIRYT